MQILTDIIGGHDVDEETLDLRDIWKTIKKRRKVIRNTFLIFVISVAVISFLLPPTYEAETTLRIKQPKGLGDSLLADLPIGNAANSKLQMSTYSEILKSRTVIQEVIDKTQSGKEPRSNDESLSIWQSFTNLFDSKEKMPDYENMLKRINTQPVKDTEILKITATAGTPEEAQLVANTVVETFSARMIGLVRSEQSMVRQFIGERLKDSKKELEKAENDLQAYKTEQKIVEPEAEIKAILDNMSNINQLAAQNAVNLAASQAKLSSLNQQLAGEKPGFIADNPVIQSYKAKIADLEVQLVTLTQNYTDKHPQVVATRAAIEESKAKLNEEVARVIGAEAPSMNPVHQGLLQGQIQAEVDVAATTAQKGAIDSVIKQEEQQLTTLPAKEKGLVRLTREANVAQEIYIMLSKRHEEARISEVMQPTDIQVIDTATLPEKPIKPKKALNIVIAAILGLFAGTGLAFMMEYMNKTIRTDEDVRNYLDLPVLGKIPDFDSKEKTDHGTGWFSRLTQGISAKVQGRG